VQAADGTTQPPECRARYSPSRRPPHTPSASGIVITGRLMPSAHIGRAVTRLPTSRGHLGTAQVLRPIIASAAPQPHTVDDRVMSYPSAPPRRTTSPDIGRLGSRSGHSLSGGSEEQIDRSDVSDWSGLRRWSVAGGIDRSVRGRRLWPGFERGDGRSLALRPLHSDEHLHRRRDEQSDTNEFISRLSGPGPSPGSKTVVVISVPAVNRPMVTSFPA
jgi:hypothetical protein